MNEAQIKALADFRKLLQGELADIASGAENIKSDDVVDDDACDAVVTEARRIAKKFNELAPVLGLEAIMVPSEPTQYCDDYEGDEGDDEEVDLGIDAEVHTDDHRATATFDATRWFSQASDKEIEELAKCGFGGDFPADDVARFMEDHDQDVADVFKYLEVYNKGVYEKQGFECHVDPDDAETWLKVNKPELAKKLFGE